MDEAHCKRPLLKETIMFIIKYKQDELQRWTVGYVESQAEMEDAVSQLERLYAYVDVKYVRAYKGK